MFSRSTQISYLASKLYFVHLIYTTENISIFFLSSYFTQHDLIIVLNLNSSETTNPCTVDGRTNTAIRTYSFTSFLKDNVYFTFLYKT